MTLLAPVLTVVLMSALVPLASARTDSEVGAVVTRPEGLPGALPVPNANVILVVVDDADVSLLRFLPKTQALIADRGATFTHYYDSLSLCCPARTTILRGQYTHNTGIWGNLWPTGGFGRFHLKQERSTVATWLSDNHYQTALMGKYLNEYPDVPEAPHRGVDPSFIPPGWSDWAVPVKGRAYDEFGYKLNVNGQVDAEYRGQDDPDNYLVDTLSEMADGFVADHAAENYLLYLTPYAPHRPFVPAPRYEDDFPGLTYPKGPSFNEADVSDKPKWIAQLPQFGEKISARIDRIYRLRAQDMEGIDDLVQHLYEAVQASGQLDRTYFVFTSDNGLHMGEHRAYLGKNSPYEEDVRLPLWVSGPGISAGTTINAVVGDIDLAPTIAELTGSPAPRFVDGRSVVPLLTGQPVAWRQYLVLERAFDSGDDGEGVGRGGLLEPADPDPAEDSDLPAYAGLHSERFVYVEYDNASQTREFYDLSVDPSQLTNLLGPGSPGMTWEQQAALTEMVTVLAEQRSCSVNTVPCK